jgi:alpha-N-arabinofuranosidase
MSRLSWCPFLFALAVVLNARDYHVSVHGDDTDDGSAARMLRTISAAAVRAQPGDTIIVHEGVYREWVKPPRGGSSEKKRITYRAGEGERAMIKGSERITTWRRAGGGTWRVELPNSFFGKTNPYALKLSGGWLHYGNWHHRGDVFLNGRSLLEMETEEELSAAEGSWFCRAGEDTTTIVANFGAIDPNEELTEISVREAVFFPEVSGLDFVTIDGLHFMHAASNWSPPVLELQPGAVGPRMGKRWIIRNCTITDCRTVGIILGHAPGVDYTDIDSYGDHEIRDNLIQRCGQAGIAGQKGATRSIIAGNLIEDTNHRREFGGWETAAIKFHNSVDTVIDANLIRRVDRQSHGAFGIWIDFANQNTRITRNIIYDCDFAAVFLEMNHGPILVDNNVLVGPVRALGGQGYVYAHNLFVDSRHVYGEDRKRRAAYYAPHTFRTVGRLEGILRDHAWFNNLFVRDGLDDIKTVERARADFNVYLEGAAPPTFGGKSPPARSRWRSKHPGWIQRSWAPLRLRGNPSRTAMAPPCGSTPTSSAMVFAAPSPARSPISERRKAPFGGH